MIVEYSPRGELSLAEPDDFRNFKLVLKSGAEPNAVAGVTFVNAGNALVDIELVPRLRGAPDTVAWRTGYRTMIANAARYGWIDTERSAIRSHVETEDRG